MPRKKNSKNNKTKNNKKSKVKEEKKMTREETNAKRKENIKNFTDFIKSELCDKMDNDEPYFVEILELHTRFGLIAQLEKSGALKGRWYIHNPSRRKLGKDFNIVTKYKRQEDGITLVHFYTKITK